MFETDINLGGEEKKPESNDGVMNEYLPEVLAKLKKINPSRYAGIDPKKLTPDSELYGEIKRQVERVAKPQEIEKQITSALGELQSSPNFDSLYQKRLGQVRAATAPGSSADALRERELAIRKRLFSAPAEAREKYKDVFDPFAREKLAQGDVGQLQYEADSVRSMREPELALYEQLPNLAQNDLEEQRKTLAEKLQNLRSLYSAAVSGAGDIDSEFNDVLKEERKKKPSGGGGSVRYNQQAVAPTVSETEAAALLDKAATGAPTSISSSFGVTGSTSALPQLPPVKRSIMDIFFK